MNEHGAADGRAFGAAADAPDNASWCAVPAALRERRSWVCWRPEVRDGNDTKVPYIAETGCSRKAKSNDPSTWRSFEEAVRHAPQPGGIGVMFSDGLAGADVDDCLDGDGNLKPWAAAIVGELDSYAEISPSGEGVKVFFFGEIPPGGNRKRVGDGEIELYSKGRFFTVTGQHLPGTPATVEPRQAEIDSLHPRLFGKSEARVLPERGDSPDLGDAQLLEKARNAKDGPLFKTLYDQGDTSAYGDDDSAADFALAHLLGFWCGPDPERIESLFARSALGQRAKWRERSDYRERTIRRALEGKADFYTPPQRRPARRRTRPVRTPGNGPRAELTRFNPTEAGNGEVLATLYGDQLRYDWQRQRWLRWGGHTWRLATAGELIALAKEAARERYLAASAAEDDVQRTWAFRSESRSRAEAAIFFSRSEPPISDTGEGWDESPMLLGCSNGVVELDRGLCRPGRPDDLLTRTVPVPYDALAPSHRWERFLDEVFWGDADLVDFVWRSIGYSLTGSVEEQVFWLLHGAGSNGKSLFLSVLRNVLGELAYSAPFSLFDQASRDAHPQNLAQLEGRRFVTAAEAAENCRLNEDRIKALTGGEPITAHLMRENDRTFPNTAKFWLAVNHRPRVLDESDAFWRRARLIPFRRRFVPPEILADDPALARDPAVLPADKGLSEALKAERAGILRWAVAGAVAWRREGLREPESVKAASQSWRDEADPLGDFLAACCLTGGEQLARAGDLFHAYCKFCEESGLRERERMTQTMFGRRMAVRFEKRQRMVVGGRQGPVYVGIGLRETDIQNG